jgi:squalene-associated FAD-dependent desaturase
MLQRQPSDARTKGGVVHIVGAGLAGLSAAVTLTKNGYGVRVYEAAGQAGGRCRSYFDAAFGQVLDNGNHLLLSGNAAALDYIRTIGGEGHLQGPRVAEFSFADLTSGQRWTLTLNKGRIPWWMFDSHARVPGTAMRDYLSAIPLALAGSQTVVTGVLDRESVLYKKLWEPVLVSALNTKLEEASAKLAGSILRNTLAKGGEACRPLVAEGLSAAMVDPAIAFIEANGGTVTLNARVKSIACDGCQVTAIAMSGENLAIAPGDAVILAVPAWIASQLLPEVKAPTAHRAILNAHFSITRPAEMPRILGIVNGLTEWVFAFPNRLSMTVSAADAVIDESREVLAARIWREVSALAGLPDAMPPWQIVKEKRATFAATPEQDALRPVAKTQWRNLFLAGDWVQTGLPATIEGAVRSGNTAAKLAMRGVYRNGTGTTLRRSVG